VIAASLPPGDYWAINIDLSKVPGICRDADGNEAIPTTYEIRQQVGGDRCGAHRRAVTLAVALIFATRSAGRHQ
jgi:hypothetical protein